MKYQYTLTSTNEANQAGTVVTASPGFIGSPSKALIYDVGGHSL